MKNWFYRLFNGSSADKHYEENYLDHTSLDEKFKFRKHDEFEDIWVADHVYRDYDATRKLNNNDYIDYHLWEDQNCEAMYKKYLPKTKVYRGVNPNIIFHGGCLGCLSQRKNGINRCKGCMFFRAAWDKPSLYIKGEKAATFNTKDCKGPFGSQDEN